MSGDNANQEAARTRILTALKLPDQALYEPSDKTKSQIYAELLPLLNRGRVELLDYPGLIGQLCGLERRTARRGRDNIDRAPGGHDDIINALSGAVVLASAHRPMVITHKMVDQVIPAGARRRMAGTGC
jgi:hypothetical protein